MGGMPMPSGNQTMYDFIFISATIGFYLVSILYTYACGRL
jgi:hypothetical protein